MAGAPRLPTAPLSSVVPAAACPTHWTRVTGFSRLSGNTYCVFDGICYARKRTLLFFIFVIGTEYRLSLADQVLNDHCWRTLAHQSHSALFCTSAEGETVSLLFSLVGQNKKPCIAMHGSLFDQPSLQPSGQTTQPRNDVGKVKRCYPLAVAAGIDLAALQELCALPQLSIEL